MQHNVFFWIKEEHKNTADLAAFEAGLEAVCQTPNITTGGWGKPAATAVRSVTDHSFNYGLYCTFDSLEKHDAYQVHPEHDVFIDGFKHLWERVLVMDVD